MRMTIVVLVVLSGSGLIAEDWLSSEHFVADEKFSEFFRTPKLFGSSSQSLEPYQNYQVRIRSPHNLARAVNARCSEAACADDHGLFRTCRRATWFYLNDAQAHLSRSIKQPDDITSLLFSTRGTGKPLTVALHGPSSHIDYFEVEVTRSQNEKREYVYERSKRSHTKEDGKATGLPWLVLILGCVVFLIAVAIYCTSIAQGRDRRERQIAWEREEQRRADLRDRHRDERDEILRNL